MFTSLVERYEVLVDIDGRLFTCIYTQVHQERLLKVKTQLSKRRIKTVREAMRHSPYVCSVRMESGYFVCKLQSSVDTFIYKMHRSDDGKLSYEVVLEPILGPLVAVANGTCKKKGRSYKPDISQKRQRTRPHLGNATASTRQRFKSNSRLEGVADTFVPRVRVPIALLR
jgi:hypothetical protein